MDADVRLAILTILNTPPGQIVKDMTKVTGFTTLDGFVRSSDMTEAEHNRAVRVVGRRVTGVHPTVPFADQDPEQVLTSVPARAFAAGVARYLQDEASDLYTEWGHETAPAKRYEIDRVLAQRSFAWAFGDDLVPGVDDELRPLIAQARTILADSRLAEARDEYDKARRQFAEGDFEDAVDHCRKAIEAALLALIADCALSWPNKANGKPKDKTAQIEFDLTVDQDILPRHAENVVLAAPAYRNKVRGGHAGGETTPPADAEAILAATVAGIRVIAARLS